jgi:hypothetical protein
MSKVTWTKYVPIHLANEYRTLGWEVDDRLHAAPHGRYAYLGVWKGEDEPPIPTPENKE